jgi:hypothetical protein
MNGGEISGNQADAGGGVFVRKDGAFAVSGNPVVSGNTNAVGEADNVYLPDGATIAVGGLSAGASIGVTTENEPEEGHPVVLTDGAAAGDAARFFSDDSGCHVAMEGGELYLVVGVGLPAYLDGANERVIANYAAWAAKYGPDVAGAHEAAFLLDIDPATPIPAGASLLKITAFSFTSTRMYIEIASDVTEFTEKSDGVMPMLGNGFLVLQFAMSLSSDPVWIPTDPVPFEIRNGRAVIDLEGEAGVMTPSIFFKAAITPFFDSSGPLGPGLEP